MGKKVIYIIVTIGLFVALDRWCVYDFIYAEQLRTFLFSEAYAREVCLRPGGMMEWLASFLVQFYGCVHVGAAVTAMMFVAAVFLCDGWLSRKGLSALAPLASLMLGGLLVILELDAEYRTEGTLAMVLCLALLNVYVRIPTFKVRMLMAVLVIPALYFIAGPAMLAWTVCVILTEVGERRFGTVALLLWAMFFPFLWWHTGIYGEARTAFLPDAYYNPHLVAKMKLHYPWILLVSAALVAGLCRLVGIRIPERERMVTVILHVAQGTLAVGLCVYLAGLAHPEYTYQLKRLDCYRIRGEWNKILSERLVPSKNELHACYRNLALAQRGVLADSLFHYPQCPPNGLMPIWKGSRHQSDLLSDIFWLQGNVAQSQKMAFDAMYFNERFMHPRLMLRLVETNLVYGEYAVAEKYINLCEQSLFYAEKAREYRKHLGGIPLDGELAERRKCLPEGEEAIVSNFHKDTQNVITAHAGHLPAVHYLGCKLLLENNLVVFKYFIENVYDLERLQPIPRHFQEAMLMLYDEEECRTLGVEETVIARYREFKEKTVNVKSRNDVATIYKAGFGHTFWVHSTIYEQKR